MVTYVVLPEKFSKKQSFNASEMSKAVEARRTAPVDPFNWSVNKWVSSNYLYLFHSF